MSKAETAVSTAGSAASLSEQANATATSAKSSADTAISNSATALSKSSTAATDASSAVSKVDAVEAKLGNYATTGQLDSVKSDVGSIDNKLSATTERVNGVYAELHPALIGSTEEFIGNSQVLAGIWSLQSATAEADMALSQRIDITQAQVDDNTVLIASETSARVDADTAIGQRIDTVQSAFESNKSTVQTQIKTVSDAQSAQSSRIDTVQSATNTAQQTANQAVLDAQSKSAAAEVAAKTYAAAQAKAEADAAKAVASGDATSKANAAESAAKAAAALDAKNKADAAQAAAKVLSDAAQSTANQALGKANNATENIATVQSQVNTLTTDQGATAKQVETIQTTVGENTASIQEVNESIDGLYAQKYIKLDANGKVAGWGGANDGKESNFIFNFDSVAIGSGNSAGYYPFIFRTTPFTDPITGTVFPVSAYLKSAMMDYQSVKTSHIEDLAVNTAKIAKLAVKSGNIDDLAVTTIKIQDEAVTVPIGVRNDTMIETGAGFSGGTTEGQPNNDFTSHITAWENYIGDLLSITVNRQGGKARIDAAVTISSFNGIASFSVGDGRGGTVSNNIRSLASFYISVFKNGAVLGRASLACALETGNINVSFNGSVALVSVIDDTNTVGNTTYVLKAGFARQIGSSVALNVACNLNFRIVNRSMSLLELKK